MENKNNDLLGMTLQGDDGRRSVVVEQFATFGKEQVLIANVDRKGKGKLEGGLEVDDVNRIDGEIYLDNPHKITMEEFKKAAERFKNGSIKTETRTQNN